MEMVEYVTALKVEVHSMDPRHVDQQQWGGGIVLTNIALTERESESPYLSTLHTRASTCQKSLAWWVPTLLGLDFGEEESRSQR